MAPPLYVLHSEVLWGCVWGFSSVLTFWYSQLCGGESFAMEGHCLGSVSIVLWGNICAFRGCSIVGVELCWRRIVTVFFCRAFAAEVQNMVYLPLFVRRELSL